jgi:WD40 repeat protein
MMGEVGNKETTQTCVVSGSLDNTLRVWNIVTGECKSILIGHQNWIASVTIMLCDCRLVSGAADNMLRILQNWLLRASEF